MVDELRELPDEAKEEERKCDEQVELEMAEWDLEPVKEGVKQEECERQPSSRVRNQVTHIVVVESLDEEQVDEHPRLVLDSDPVAPGEVI